jgi:hypothetical protein
MAIFLNATSGVEEKVQRRETPAKRIAGRRRVAICWLLGKAYTGGRSDWTLKRMNFKHSSGQIVVKL